MTIHQTLMFSIGLSAVGVGGMESAMAQACTHDGPVVSASKRHHRQQAVGACRTGQRRGAAGRPQRAE